jgi:hypothetical protein
MPIKFQSLEDTQLPRWVYALMKANEDPTDMSDSPLTRGEINDKAQEIFNQRRERLKAMAESSPSDGGRIDGLAWKHRPRSTFSEEELNKIMPTRQLSFVMHRGLIIGVIFTGVAIGTALVLFLGIAACAELKLGGTAANAWTAFQQDPVNYFHRVINAFDW